MITRTHPTHRFPNMSILSDFTAEEIESVINDNSSLRGYLQGYLAEIALKKRLLLIPGVTHVEKIRDQSKEKGDLRVTYRDCIMTIEVKSVSTDSVRDDLLNESWQGTVSLKSSDKRELVIEGVGIVDTTSLPKGEFDILAISIYAVAGTWDFLYIENEYLPEKDPELPGLLKTRFVVNPEITPCVYPDIQKLMDEVVEKKLLAKSFLNV